MKSEQIPINRLLRCLMVTAATPKLAHGDAERPFPAPERLLDTYSQMVIDLIHSQLVIYRDGGST